MPYLAIPDSVAGTIYTDYEGNASGVTPGSRTLAVDGRYFDVNYFSGSPYSQSVNVEPGLPFNIALNPTDETGKAAMNAYIESNVVRDFSLARNPSYPTIGGQQNWDINIGVSAATLSMTGPPSTSTTPGWLQQHRILGGGAPRVRPPLGQYWRLGSE